ncbi:DUF4293 domain-containing protein [Flavobacterium hibernum]|uniref:Transcription termination factor Rho n=1 Tax=Flavobacterium hibernum TaxID=37752 RepID=A0A0D0EJB1_9FLAO|nr:DUF4293 domain-containing protein [Flavobacterium hibernum]KIO50900.1 transcription termination factor Rho [Flavobacterium hibernum]OXA85401.1 transcription termination factor Rho [Flavobacterium hibernum]STO10935.1 Uncharacterised protein [Flavobacterium hibernum]
MIQRIQTVYLILAFIATSVLMLFIPLWTLKTGTPFYFNQDPIYTVIVGLSTMLTIISIISYKKRQNQFVMGRLNIILNLILLGLFVYRSLNLSGDATAVVSEKGIGMFLPIVAIVLLVLANKAIKKDEDLVKSVDRLR